MNIEIEKKKYLAPRMDVLNMGGDFYLLSCSGGDCDVDQGDYDDEFGFNLGGDVNRHV